MESVYQWLSQFWIVLVAIMGGITYVWNFFRKTVKEIKEDINKPFVAINARFDEVEKRIDNKHCKDEAVVEALLTMQRKSILDSCEKYIAIGYANLHQKEVLMAQFESYKKLGGNSFVHELVDQVQNLPIDKKEKKTLNE